MKINIKTTNVDLTDDVKRYIIDKIIGLEKFIQEGGDSEMEAYVEVGKPSQHHRQGEDVFYAECNIEIGKRIFRGEMESKSIQGAIDGLRDVMQRELSDYKEKQETIYRRSARTIKKLLSLSPLARFRKKNKPE